MALFVDHHILEENRILDFTIDGIVFITDGRIADSEATKARYISDVTSVRGYRNQLHGQAVTPCRHALLCA